MASSIKHTQLTRVGYTYQDFMCIQLLVEWFHQPDKYQWVCIEGTKDKGRFKGLDDVIAFNKDGRYEIFQVKFTIDSQRDDLKLSFDWLLDKTGRGTSLLQKWEDAAAKYNSENLLSIAALKTNRTPDDEFAKCIHNNKIVIDQIPDGHLENIKKQLGGYEKAKIFFEIFTFDHSQPKIDDLENKLHDGLVPDHSTTEGWLQLLKAVERWATRKDEPVPDGKIKIDHVREILTATTLRSISQYFEVPESYVPPSEVFHLDMLKKCKSSGCWVVSGLPGMGKSTYLSYLVESLTEQGNPVIRHHYSLSAQSVIDRISYPNAARSLQSQLQLLFPSLFNSHEYDPEKLDEWILQASDEASRSENKLIVVIDGLDHVARERSEITQLEHLINRLIPLRENICLILGTQPVSDVHLPSLLISSVPRDQCWLKLPPMDLNAIKCWVGGLLSSKKVTLVGSNAYKARELVDVSESLLKASGGYPLHLIYSMKSLTLHDKCLNKYDIEKLPACPDGDIHSYYTALWSNLSSSAREILLLIACVEFPWPDENSMGFCFGNSLQFKEAFDEVQHLVEKRRSGIVPFHGSVLVFLRSRQEYRDSSHRLLLKIKNWLTKSAPEYWRWGWDWIIDARLGDIEPLVNGITHDWSVESFRKGYPLQHIEHIIATAEVTALDHGEFEKLVGLRLIKIRLINGPEFQIQEYEEFLKCALKWDSESYGLLWRADNIRFLNDKELPIVSSLFGGLDETVAEDCFEEVIRRLTFYARIEDGSQHSKIDSLINAGIDILTDVPNPNIDEILKFLGHLRDKETFFVKMLDKLIAAGNGYLILDIPSTAIPEGLEGLYWNYFVLLCCSEGIALIDRPEREQAKISTLGVVALLLEEQSVDTKQLVEPSQPGAHENATDDYFYNLFFFSFAAQLEKGSDIKSPANVRIHDADSFVRKATSTFKYIAHCIAVKIKEKDNIDISEIYKLIKQSNLPDRKECDFDSAGVWHSISKALTRISLDMYLLLLSMKKIEEVNSKVFKILADNNWWCSTAWLEKAALKSMPIIPKEIAEQEIQSALSCLLARKDSTSILANDSLDLAKLSRLLGLKVETQQCLKLAAQHILGYGERKDTTFSEIFEAIEACSEYGVGNISDWLRRVAPFTNDMFDYTEREIRHIPRWYIDLLAKYSPERLVDEFDYHLTNQTWSIAHDVLEKYVEYFPLSVCSEHAFLRCLTSYEVLTKLKERAEKDSMLLSLYKSQCNYLGGFPPAPRDSSSSSSIKEKDIDIRLDAYPPEKLNDLEEELGRRNIYLADEFIEGWISYWAQKDRGLDVIEAFEETWDDDRKYPTRLGCGLAAVFSISHKLQGAKKAYQWAVRDIRVNSHWNRWSGSKAEKYLKRYARIYKSDWKKLLVDTTKGELIKLRGNEWVVVPTSQLVKYLLAAEQTGLACRITEVMIKSLENEIAHLPISPLHWYEKPVPFDQIAPRLLLLYYKWPDRLVRLRTANEIAKLLNSDLGFRRLYLENLNKQNYEVEVTDLLSVLLLTESRIFTFEELSTRIRYGSILSDELFQRLGYENYKIGENSRYYSKVSIQHHDESKGFGKSKNGMPPIYFNIIEELGQRIDYPLSKHMAAEWEKISTRQELSYFDPYDFCGDQFYRQDRISCSFSSQTESVVLSAYLRTLAFAFHEQGASKEDVANLAVQLCPFGGLYSKIVPSIRPEGWPILSEVSKEDDLPTEDDLSEYLIDICKGREVIVSASGPVLRKASGVGIDLDVKALHIEDGVEWSPEEIYKSIAYKGNGPEGVHLLAGNSYPGSMGRWEVDWLLRGFYQLNFAIGAVKRSVLIGEDDIEYASGGIVNAVWKYWTHNWYPASYRHLGCSLGTYLTITKDILDVVSDQFEGSIYLLGKLTMIDKREYHRDDNTIEIYTLHEIK